MPELTGLWDDRKGFQIGQVETACPVRRPFLIPSSISLKMLFYDVKVWVFLRISHDHLVLVTRHRAPLRQEADLRALIRRHPAPVRF